MERMWFVILTVEYKLEAHTSCKMFKVMQELTPGIVFIRHECWYEFEPFGNDANLIVS